MISIPDELKALMDKYNKTHPYEKINLSQITQRALYEKITEKEARTTIIADTIAISQEPVHKSEPKACEEARTKEPDTEEVYTKVCPYCNKSFETTNKAQKFCNDSHRNMFNRKKKNLK
jgi:uncharacterized C2H2 Zn-finger protein